MHTIQCGSTPLHRAATGGHLEAVKLLLDRGASVDAKNNVSSRTLEKDIVAWNREDKIR